MGVQMSKISYKMSDVEQRLGYGDEDGEFGVKTGPTVKTVAGIEEASAISTTSFLNSSAQNPYHSNSSLSSGAGEISCVQLSWPKAAVDKLSKRRKGSKSNGISDRPDHPVKIHSTKKAKGYLRGIASKKQESILASDSSATTGNVSLPSTSSSCVCTAYRRTSSAEPQDSIDSVPALGLVPTGHRLSSPHVLGAFNPDDYPIEDEDEKMRRQRAREIAEGVELTDTFGLLSFQKSNNSCQTAHSQVDYVHCLVPDLKEITSCSFYWGKIDRYAAEKLLEDKPEGTFLLRDSAQEEYLFSVSFRRYGRSLHARIEQWNQYFSFDAHDPSVFSAKTVTGLIEHYKDPSYCMFFEPMLTIRLHRNFTFSLQHLSRSVICKDVTYDSISQLPLPKQLKAYCREYHFKQRVRVRTFPE